MPSPPPSPNKPITLITGSNTGIGLATAKALSSPPYNHHVLIASRSLPAGQAAAASLTSSGLSASAIQLDVTSSASIAAAVKHIETEYGRLDVLINNAGVLLDTRSQSTEMGMGMGIRELFERTFAVNVTGAAEVMEGCLPLLRKAEVEGGARVVFVSSRMGSVSEATNKETIYYNIDYKAYDASKAALNMVAINYARILEGEGKGGLVNVACPGLVQTKLSGNHPMGTSTELGAQRIVELATLEEGGLTMTFSDRDGGIPW